MEHPLHDYQPSTYFPFGFHLCRERWERLDVRSLIVASEGGDAKTNIHTVRKFVQAVNLERDGASPETSAITAGQVLTLGLLTEILRYITDLYCWEQHPGVLEAGLNAARAGKGDAIVRNSPPAFVDLFPPQDVLLGTEKPGDFLKESQGRRSNRDMVVCEMILLWLAHGNRALRSFHPLFPDQELSKRARYRTLMTSLDNFFASQPQVAGLDDTLIECLRAPMRAAPDSLEDQLEFIRARWGHLLPKSLLNRLILVRGILREETIQRGFVQGTAEVLRFGRQQGADWDGYPEPERFSRDADWMSNVVLIAKTVYVWMDQLSKTYQRDIYRLDHIPDEELDRLARWGFNGLWLIGLWERSPASEEIKRMMGNPEAVSSAYSLYDYDIAADLGGEEAYQSLKERAMRRGIRLASDMVPNHMGIYSRWVIEHPHWFLSLDYPPYPAYRFTGKNLSRDGRAGIYIEDGYWNHSDAAVVFKRVDHQSGQTQYIYHGNDGTSMPWNDTAQLNYLLPEVREGVIQTILHVARKFSIIRFDAAMTLAKKHYQRLWFPKAGDAGAIPSRAEHGMSRADFDAQMPEEFWREVVDRVAREVPDTLLLAEAFWLMEGYFVRSLGMHRVYNSAFMNMLKMEQNADYRTTVKNVLEFSPEILKRFVNFMNNPDERTAVEQFGKGDKYFGVALLMVTMPGLPMFGHGQIEGFTEKYGMEYRKAYWDEHVDEEMVRRHEREIFPLMRRRYLFSGVEHFAFYDFHTPSGHVDDNVFAYSNRAGDERAIVLYNNAYNTTEGWIRVSTALNSGRGDDGTLIHKTLADSLALRGDDHIYYLFRDHRDGLQYIRSGRQLCAEGAFVRLHAYGYHVFLDFREVVDRDGSWGTLAHRLRGDGVYDIELEHRRLALEPILTPYRELVTAKTLLLAAGGMTGKGLSDSEWAAPEGALRRVVEHVGSRLGTALDADAIQQEARSRMENLRLAQKRIKAAKANADAETYFLGPIPSEEAALGFWRAPALAALLRPLGDALSQTPPGHAAWLDEWLFAHEAGRLFAALGGDEWNAWQDVRLLRLILGIPVPQPMDSFARAHTLVKLLKDPAAREYLMVNRHEGVDYVNREQMESLLYRLSLAEAAEVLADKSLKPAARRDFINERHAWVGRVLAAAESGSYRLADLEAWAAQGTAPETPPRKTAKSKSRK
ncbi:MAG: alpha-amylase [Candidatus Hydrogenedentes bacterium]|nr:alpha-amylase [Candidatus Hydrogenedentota bacterium]